MLAPSLRSAITAREPSAFPAWIDGTGPEPPIMSWAYDRDTIILRQSLRTHFEAPFIVLLAGRSRALLIDSGTGDVDIRAAVDVALEGRSLDLLVAHSHAHSDHVGGDTQFAQRRSTSVVGHSARDVANAFGLGGGDFGTCSDVGSIDLGERVLDVLAIPGHESTHVAFYDRMTQLLFTGDTLYPGRLTVRDWKAYRSSVARLVRFIDRGRPVRHVLGSHIELSANGDEYAPEVTVHSDEHRLELEEAHLRDLLATVTTMGDDPVRTKRPSYVVEPLR